MSYFIRKVEKVTTQYEVWFHRDKKATPAHIERFGEHSKTIHLDESTVTKESFRVLTEIEELLFMKAAPQTEPADERETD